MMIFHILDALIGSLKTYLDRCLNAGALSLTHLARIEEKLLEEFEFPAFCSMGYGRFLEFLLAEMKQVYSFVITNIKSSLSEF